MSRHDVETLPVATRAWTERQNTEPPAPQNGSGRKAKRYGSSSRINQTLDSGLRPTNDGWRGPVLILDTETTTDPTQRLTFGSYRYGRWRTDGTLAILEEGLFHADELAGQDLAGYTVLQTIADTVSADVWPDWESRRSLALRSRRDFLDHVLWPAVQADALIVGFNPPSTSPV